MRINKFLSQHTNLSRRKADDAIAEGRVLINGVLAKNGDVVIESDAIILDNKLIQHTDRPSQRTIMLNKPTGYVASRNGQGSNTIYNLIPKDLHHLNPAGRLDKDSSGLLLMTNNGEFLNKLTHPSFNKDKIYLVSLDQPLNTNDLESLKYGVDIGDKKLSKIKVKQFKKNPTAYTVTLSEGRNRQIRRTFHALGIRVIKLHRIQFGSYKLGDLAPGEYIDL